MIPIHCFISFLSFFVGFFQLYFSFQAFIMSLLNTPDVGFSFFIIFSLRILQRFFFTGAEGTGLLRTAPASRLANASTFAAHVCAPHFSAFLIQIRATNDH
eukprot:GHVT01019230.1.p1 GENE.GHVT01019230.1~~GHVT01019230.1.p1  ORF type:complete len:115 (+),score=4.19 GHVT01019230.1:44-346(+)